MNGLFTRAPLIGIGGYYESGKDALADTLADEKDGPFVDPSRYAPPPGIFRRAMSTVLDEFLIAQNPWVVIEEGQPHYVMLRAALNDRTGGTRLLLRYASLREHVDYDASKKIPDLRLLLQTTGTEAGRNIIGQETWLTLAHRSAGSMAEYARSQNMPSIITGIRYANERQMIRDMGGLLIWVERPEATAKHQAAEGSRGHTSETEQSPEDYHVVVHNDGTLDQLASVAQAIGRYFFDLLPNAHHPSRRIKMTYRASDQITGARWEDVGPITTTLGLQIERPEAPHDPFPTEDWVSDNFNATCPLCASTVQDTQQNRVTHMRWHRDNDITDE